MKELFRRKYLISFFYIIICVIGISVWKLIPIENTPDLTRPSITVSYTWGTTAPEIMEQEITRKVEREANRLRDVSEIRSVTSEGRSQVTITFLKDAPIDYRVLELREYLFGLNENLPESVRPPQINRQVPEELEGQQTFVVYTLNADMEPRNLLEYTKKSIIPKLLALDGLAQVSTEGVRDPALIIEFDREQLEKYKLNPSQILFQVREFLSWRSSGYVDEGNSRYSLIIPPKFKNTADIASLKIDLSNSYRKLKLDDIASVSIGEYPATSIKRINGDPALTISFVKESGADAFTLARQIHQRMDEIKTQLPQEMILRMTVDSTEELRAQFDSLQLQAILSGILVFLVVILFIRKIRAPVIIIGSVAFSVLLSVIVLYLIGYSLNIITLAGLTIALGMLIDNAVVVFEHLNPDLPSDKESRLEHIRKELPKAVVPVIGSTFTTVGIFVPLLFALEELRIFLLPLAAALTITLLSSVVIAFTWIPYSLIWLTSSKISTSGKSRVPAFLNRLLLLSFIWKSRLKWILIPALIFVIGIPLFAIEEPDWEDEKNNWPEFTQAYFDNRSDIDPWIGGITNKFFSETYFGSPWRRNTEERISVYIRSPQGTPLSEINKIVKNFETIALPYKDAFVYYEANMSEYYGASIQFIVKDEYLYENAPYYFLGEAMYLGTQTGNVATTVSGFNQSNSTGYGGGTSNHTIRLYGYSYDELLGLAKELERRLKKSRRVREVDVNKSYSFSSRDDFHQYVLRLDEGKLLAQGLDRRRVLSSLQLDLNSKSAVGKVEFNDQEMYLFGRTESDRSYEEDVMNKIRSFGNVNFNVAAVGEIVKEKALTEIIREDQSYQRLVDVNYLGNYRMASDYIKEVIESTPVPVGTSIRYGGGGYFSFGNEDETRNILFISLLSLLSVWMIVSALLESVKYPMFVILAVPYSAIGIMMGVLFNDMAFDRGAIAGALLSIGVVVNNAILLYHQKQLENEKGIFGLRCWAYVYKKRLRAILITTATTITGLLPMMLLGGDEFWENLAIVVIWGLSASTILLLLMTGVRLKKKSREISKNQI